MKPATLLMVAMAAASAVAPAASSPDAPMGIEVEDVHAIAGARMDSWWLVTRFAGGQDGSPRSVVVLFEVYEPKSSEGAKPSMLRKMRTLRVVPDERVQVALPIKLASKPKAGDRLVVEIQTCEPPFARSCKLLTPEPLAINLPAASRPAP